MDIILFIAVGWYVAGLLGFRTRKPKRRHKPRYWKPSLDVFDWEEHLRRNSR